MLCVSLQRKLPKFQEEPSDLETQLLELGFLCENENAVGQTTAGFAYNAHGSMASMPHLSAMDWDFAEKLSHITRGTTEAYYSYDGNGIRTRKVVVKNGVTETRLYLGGFEIWRKTVNGTLETERETLHVMDDQKRIAIVETLTVENAVAVANPAPVLRYQLDNHLGSASLELDDSANVISYEEYYPYGDTSYRAGRSASEVSQKRYRYTGKEKDEESGLYYHGARYYACWLGRWTAADPIGIGDGLNVYMYVQGNPVKLQDPNGTQTENNDEVKSLVNDEKNQTDNIKDEIEKVKQKILDEINQGYDLNYSELFSDKDISLLIDDFINDFKNSNEDVEWLAELKNLKFKIEMINFPMAIKKNGEYEKIPRAATVNENGEDKIKLNVGKQNYKKPKDYNELKPFLLHELRHIWQLNNPNWKEKYAAKDIDIEVDAFEWQYKLERILEVEPTEQRKEFEKSTTKEEQAKYLWSFYSNRKNNQGDSMYSNTYGFKRK